MRVVSCVLSREPASWSCVGSSMRVMVEVSSVGCALYY